MMVSDAAKSIKPDIAKTNAWKIGLFVILIIFSLFITGTSILNSQSGKQGDFKMEQVAFEIYTKYSQQLDTMSGKN